MTALKALFATFVIVLCTPAYAQVQDSSPKDKAFQQVPERPMAILVPADGEFVIPPVYVRGVAEPGETLGIFVNGYPHNVVKADARGQFTHRIAWSHSGKVAIEVRRGDKRRHRIEVKVASVTPGVSTRVLPPQPEPRALLAAENKAKPPAPARWNGPASPEAESSMLKQFSAPVKQVTPVARHIVSMGLGYMLSFGVVYAAGLTDQSGSGSYTWIRNGTAANGGVQSASAYTIHGLLGGEPTIGGTMLGAFIPTVLGLIGTAVENNFLVASGLLLQPVGASIGASF